MTPPEEKTAGAVQSPVMNTGMALELFSIAGSLNSTPDLDYLLEKIGVAAERLLDSEASSIMLVSDDRKYLFFKVAGGSAGAKLKKMTVQIGKGIAGWVAQHGKPEVVNDTTKDPRFAGQFDKTSGFITRSLLCVPMFFRGELVGVVEVLNKRQGIYTEEHIGLLTALANLASVAITNTRIIQEQKNFFSHVLELLVGMIEISRPKMMGHPNRVARFACALVKTLGGDDYEYRMMYYAGLLHDMGYVGFQNPKVLAEAGIMSPAEQQHPLLSIRMLEGIKMLEGSLPIIRHHHEHYDGTGYPGKLKGEDIPMGARILALVEALEEMRMSSGLSGDDLARQAVQDAQAGKGSRFDPQVVEAAVGLLQSGQSVW